MAAVDKIYGSRDEWQEFFYWLAEHRPQYCKYLYPPFWTDYSTNPPTENAKQGPISNFPTYADKWLYKHCELKWVKARIKEQYNGDPSRKRK